RTEAGDRRLWLPGLLCGLLGLILLTAAAVKAMDMELFIRQMRDYEIISHRTLLVLSAWGVIVLECTLGVGLIVNYRPRLILPLTALLVLGFVGATSWAWLTGTAEKCGCFGAWLERSPGEAVAGNVTLLVGAVVAWVRYGQTQPSRSRTKAWATIVACLIGVGLPMAFGFPISRVNHAPSDPANLLLGPIEIQGLEEVDLNRGTHLIIVMATDCDHCQESILEINMLVDMLDLPSPIGLCTNEESERKMFLEEFEPFFPIGQISDDDFWRLLAEGDLPRVILVSDGRIVQVWDQMVPDEDTIRASLPF
ncbi:MAG: hypothetical protein JRI47_04700, partial [Deltaproteobacteria bacterium]|nr:hypothetical protein [Deltaproteobacteria bacterium]